MKKFFVLAVVLVLAAFTVSAQSADRFTLGGRLGVDFGINGLAGNYTMYGLTRNYTEGKSLVGFGLAPYVTYAINDKFAVQTELNFMFNQGMKRKLSEDIGYGGVRASIESTVSYSSLDIPALIKYAFIDNPVSFGLLAGPYLSIPLGKEKSETSLTLSDGSYSFDISDESDLDGVKFGITAGLFVGYPIGPGRIVGDLRFLTDFGPLKAKDGGELFTRRSINLTAGYEISLGGNSSASSSRSRRR